MVAFFILVFVKKYIAIFLFVLGSFCMTAQHIARAKLDSLRSSANDLNAEEIIDQLNKIAVIGVSERDFPTTITTLNFLGNFYTTANNFSKVDSVISVALAIAQDTSKISDVTLSSVLNNAAIVERRKGNLKYANQLLLEAIEIEKTRRGDLYELGILYHNIAGNYRLYGDYNSALEFTVEALKSFIKALQVVDEDDKVARELGLIDEYYLLALSYQDVKEYPKAIEILEEGLSYANQCTNKVTRNYKGAAKIDDSQYNESTIKLIYGIAENYLALRKPEVAKIYIQQLKMLQKRTSYLLLENP